MVTWGRAFKAAAAYVGFVILWYIVGMIVILAGAMQMAMRSPFAGPPGPANIAIYVICLIVGVVIIVLGSMAALFKILPEVIAEEVGK
ncbi:MAG: hypothetical protein ACXQTS_05315 [Candidatus Methanospirareceae archaeon]